MERLLDLIYQIEKEKEGEKPKQGPFLEVSEVTKKMAEIYEAIRNIVEIREEHLLRRAAIERIIRRQIFVERKKKINAKEVLLELIRAGYLKNNTLPESEVPKFEAKVKLFFPLIEDLEIESSPTIFNFFASILSVEFEKLFDEKFFEKEKLLANLCFSKLKPLIKSFPKEISQKESDLLLYLSILKVIFKNDEALLKNYLFNSWLKNEIQKGSFSSEKLKNERLKIIEGIEKYLSHPYFPKYQAFVKKYRLCFWLYFEALEELAILSKSKEEFFEKAGIKEKILKAVERVYFRKVEEASEKIKRVILRSILFLLFTKIIFTLILEYPYEKYFLKKINYLALIANTLFHPFCLAVFGIFSFKPQSQIELIKTSIEEMFFEKEPKKIVLPSKISSPSGIGNFILKILWSISFVLIWYFIIKVLLIFKFNLISIILFVIFLSLVFYLGWRAQGLRKELILKEKESFLGTLALFFALPIIKLGEWISKKFSKYNLIIYVLDFLVESPFKLILKFLERWIFYTREKKEEIET